MNEAHIFELNTLWVPFGRMISVQRKLKQRYSVFVVTSLMKPELDE